jgi:hypothetical protein
LPAKAAQYRAVVAYGQDGAPVRLSGMITGKINRLTHVAKIDQLSRIDPLAQCIVYGTLVLAQRSKGAAA